MQSWLSWLSSSWFKSDGIPEFCNQIPAYVYVRTFLITGGICVLTLLYALRQLWAVHLPLAKLRPTKKHREFAVKEIAAVLSDPPKNGVTQQLSSMSDLSKSATTEAFAVAREKPRAPSTYYRVSLLDRFLALTLTIALSFIIFNRLRSGVLHHLLQPCHLVSPFVIKMILSERRDDPTVCAVYFASWQCWIAYVAIPEYETFTDLALFWIQHVCVTVVPVYYVIVGRFSQAFANRGRLFSLSVATSAATVLYHLAILLPLSYITNTDFDNTLCPLKSAYHVTGDWWHQFMTLLAFSSTTVLYLISYAAESVRAFFRPRTEHLKSS